MRRDPGMQAIAVLLLAIVIVGIIVALIGCAHLPPAPQCDPRKVQVRDPDHRIMGTADCYTCVDAPPGGFDEGNHYRCLDDTCAECEAQPEPGMFGRRRPDMGAR